MTTNTSNWTKHTDNMSTQFDALAEELIRAVLAAAPGLIREGTVMTPGPPPYRRLDCRGRALAYVRSRPRKRGVRVDISGLWDVDKRSRIEIPASTGSATLLIRSRTDIAEAVEVLTGTVVETLEAAASFTSCQPRLRPHS